MTNLEYIYNTSISRIVSLTENRERLEKYLTVSDRRPDASRLFVRDTPLSLARLLAFMIMPRARSCQSELETFFDGMGFRIPGKSAFSMKRKLISPDIFLSLNGEILDDFYRLPHTRRWKGRYVIAVDGTTLTMPAGSRFEPLYGYAGLPQDDSKRLPTARAVVVSDVLNRQILGVRLGQYGSHEPELALEAILALPDHILHNSVLIFDRLYLSSWLLTMLHDNDIQYVMRCRRNFSPVIDAFFDNKRKHMDVLLRPSTEAWRTKTSARFNRMGIAPAQHRPLFLHLTKSRLHDGNIEVICSWTGDVRISAAQAYALYGRRWEVETAIGLEKNEWQVELFSGYSRTAILQDIYCKVVSFNLCSMSISAANSRLHGRSSRTTRRNNRKVKPRHQEHQYRVNVNMALFSFKRLLVRTVRHRDRLHALMLRYIEDICRCHEPYRPGLSYPRVFVKHKANGKYVTFTNYARVI